MSVSVDRKTPVGMVLSWILDLERESPRAVPCGNWSAMDIIEDL